MLILWNLECISIQMAFVESGPYLHMLVLHSSCRILNTIMCVCVCVKGGDHTIIQEERESLC
jgi:hypothetical protein